MKAETLPCWQIYCFSSSHVWMWELDHKENWALKNWCFWTVVLEKTLESPFDCKEIQPVNPEGNQSWIFIEKTDGEVEAPILWPLDVKDWLIRKDPYPGKDWRQENKGMTKDEVVGWHLRLSGNEFEYAPGVGDGQGSLVCCSSWSHKQSDITEWLNWLNRLNRSRKNFDKIQHLLMVQTLQKVGIEGIYLKIIKTIHEKYRANAILSGENIPLKSWTRQVCPLSPLLFNSLWSPGHGNLGR